MANNYLQFSEVIPDLKKEEIEWIEIALKDYSGEFNENLEPSALFSQLPDDIRKLHKELHPDVSDFLDFGWKVTEEPTLWLYAEEYGNIEQVATFVGAFLAKFRPTETFEFSWAVWCSKLRIGEFGGGTALVTADWTKWYDAPGIQKLAEMYQKAKRDGERYALEDLERDLRHA